MTRKQSVPNIRGPEVVTEGKDIQLPKCVQIKTEQDAAEFKTFLETVIKAANENALDRIADYVAEQNKAMTHLVKTLGAS
jgi:hypothetical protein